MKISKKEWFRGVKTCRERYLRNNNEEISEGIASTHMFWNNICDQIAKEGNFQHSTLNVEHRIIPSPSFQS